jgi:hypothetical protein
VGLGFSGPGDLMPRLPGQCVLVTFKRFLDIAQHLWLDNLYIRHHPLDELEVPDLLSCWEGCHMWLTSVSLQGDLGKGQDVGSIAVGMGQLYAEGELSACFVPNVLRIEISASIILKVFLLR